MYKNRKNKPTQPDYSGNATIDGKKYRLAGWINKSKSGTSYLRILISDVPTDDLNTTISQQTMPISPMPTQGPVDSVMLEDDLPF